MTATERHGMGRLRSMLAPLGAAAAAGAAFAVVAVVDPNEPGHYPPCPFLWLTGLYCPGCGGLRAMHALAQADLPAALGLNPLAVVLLPVAAVLWARWTVRAWTGRPAPARKSAHPAFMWLFLAVIIVYWAVRNLPFGSFLAP